jgi:hypothetical protein
MTEETLIDAVRSSAVAGQVVTMSLGSPDSEGRRMVTLEVNGRVTAVPFIGRASDFLALANRVREAVGK